MKGNLNVRFRAVFLFPLLAAFFMLVATGAASASTIGGSLWTGAQLPDGSPQLEGNAPIINDGVRQIKIMVEDTHGVFVAYGTVDAGTNTWSAAVPGPGEYVALFIADGHDVTSRQYNVPAGNVSVTQDAYLPPAPVPTSNLLVYTFKDHYVNSEDDYPMDYALKGVRLTVRDEKGNIVAEGISGTQDPSVFPLNAGPDFAGLYYFMGLKPGSYEITADMSGTIQISDPTIGQLVDVPASTEWLQISSLEGTNVEEVTLYPGDPGTFAGGYLTWFAFVDKPAALAPAPDAGSISGRLYDADGPWFAAEPFTPPASQADKVTPNLYMPDGLVVLYPNIQTIGVVKPIAVAEADPVTGEYTFENVPPGNYRLYSIDKTLDYIWQETQTTVTPGAAVAGVDIYLPRWFARIHGTVTDISTGNPIADARITLRIKDGSIWKETTTDANGKYMFPQNPEVEVLGVVSVEPPAGYRAVMDSVNNYDLSSKTIQWYSANYKADLQLEPIPVNEGVIRGFVRNDNVELGVDGVWHQDGLYDEAEEKTYANVTVELLDASGAPVTDVNGNAVVVKTGKFDKPAIQAQGWILPYSVPPDEFGGVFDGTVVGLYEFRGVLPGSYQVRVVTPNGFAPVDLNGTKAVEVAGGGTVTAHLGIKTEVPQSGEIEGGIFDDVNLDPVPQSALFDEKAALPGAPLSAYDHLGYFLGVATMGNPLCYAGSPVCPCGAPGVTPGCAVEKPEVGIHVAPGPHIFLGNDPAFPNNGFNPAYEPLPWTYEFGQGKYKLEADWSLIPLGMAIADGGGFPGLGNNAIQPQNQPVIISITQIAQNGASQFALTGLPMFAMNDSATMTDASFQVALITTTVNPNVSKAVLRITGNNFGDAQGNATVTLSGVKLSVKSWANTQVEVYVPVNAISGALVIATSTGISNPMFVDIVYNATWAAYMNQRSVFVDANAAGSGDGSKANPYTTITEALNNLPAVSGPRYVFVLPGTYNERIQITESNVKLVGYGASETIIDGLSPLLITPTGIIGGGPIVYIGRGGMDGWVDNITISGFTIKGGSSNGDAGGGIFADYGNKNIDINTSIITQNGGEYGGGIWLHRSNHNVNIWSNTIAANGSVGGYGGGISVNDEPEYEDGPEVPYGANEHLLDDGRAALTTAYNIYNNLVFYNVSPDYGGGMSLYEVKDKLNIFGNVIMENKSYDHGGGIFFEDCGPVELYGNVFMHNYAADDGGAVSFEDVGDNVSLVRVYNNLFAENIADDRGEATARGGALAFDDTLRAEVFSNTIVGNIVAGANKGAYSPRGAGIDSERHGHEYMHLTPAFSDVKTYNNIIWNNKRLEYDLIYRRGREYSGQDYRMGVNYRWTRDDIHVDNPAVQGDWEKENNSESFSHVIYNDISDGTYATRTGNVNKDPKFVNPAAKNWHLLSTTQLSNKAPAATSPTLDLDRKRRTATGGFVEMGAYELVTTQPNVMSIPQIQNLIVVPAQ